MRISVVTAWFPYGDDTVSGIFVLENIRAIRAAGHEVIAVHTLIKHTHFIPHFRIYREVFRDIPVIRIVLVMPIWLSKFKSIIRNVVQISNNHVSIIIGRKCLSCNTEIMPARVRTASSLFQRFFETFFSFALVKLLRGSDIVHAYVAFPSGVAAARAASRLKIPFIYTEVASDLGIVYGLKSEGKRCDSLAKKLQKMIDKADLFIAVSKDEFQQYESIGIVIPKDRREVIHTIFDERLFYLKEPIKQVRESMSRVQAVFCGILSPKEQKGMQVLIPAVAQLPEAVRSRLKIKVIGYGEMLEKYKTQTKELGLSDHFAFLGRCDLAEIGKIMMESDFFLIPSLHEGMPCVLIEALACGLPVVGSQVGGIGELVDDSIGILVKPGNDILLAEGIERMINSPSIWDRRAIANRVVRSSYFGYGEHITGRYSKILLSKQ